ncbi:helix-turn-helix transcriptional regulator [Enterococcus hulanensis]|uniref:helix-turn-helix domain-containing protein n=1 Tax=Enterococcus TaxID=1350 RepID=UPI000B5A27BF|nr:MULTISPECIES: helix-turn-helix transcriptional regulator [Enterococcus]MBO0412231.1 helix-turn-helix transcriptional regulator [Enterococcus hulanensis]OTO20428.1 hypothetical protein A5875_001781 [Enterococcus sp. 3H8_DIV0648]
MFSEKLKELRKSKGISQEALSEVLAVSRQSISKYENGTAEPDFEKLAIIADFFQVSYDYLLADSQREDSQKLVLKEKDHRIAIISKIDGQMSSYYKFQINKVYGKKEYHPAAQLTGVDSHSFWGDKQNALGWYATFEDAQKEIEAIYTALSKGEFNYELRYDIAVKKKGTFDFEMVFEEDA